MGTTTRLTGVAGLALAAAALSAAPASASPAPARAGAGAVFVQTDNVGGNAIVAYDRSSNGALREAGTYPTGGRGGVLDGSAVDHLASQGSLAYDRAHGLLYAVNAGSDTLTVFGVVGDRLVRRQVVSTGGSFPVSVATHGNLVYVLNARAGGSVQGFRRVGGTLLRVPGWHRELGLTPVQGTDEFTHTPGQVAFTPDGTRLLVTTKANGNDIDVFTVDRTGGLSTKPVVDADPDAVPFAVAFDSHAHLVVAEAGTNAVATFTIGRGGRLTLVSRTPTGQAATCWITFVDGNFYASNAGSGSLSGYRPGRDGSLAALGDTATDPGTVDTAASPDGRYLYVQTGANGIVDGYRVAGDGSLTPIGSVAVPAGAGGEGIAAS
jgi:6-phosphogluconolactonase (cycloisomerase 2 family)